MDFEAGDMSEVADDEGRSEGVAGAGDEDDGVGCGEGEVRVGDSVRLAVVHADAKGAVARVLDQGLDIPLFHS